MHVMFTSSDQAILHFLRLEAWNYSKELWVNEVWHNPHLPDGSTLLYISF